MEDFKPISICGCFHYDAVEKQSCFKSCETCDYAEKILFGWICGHVKYSGGKNEKKKED